MDATDWFCLCWVLFNVFLWGSSLVGAIRGERWHQELERRQAERMKGVLANTEFARVDEMS